MSIRRHSLARAQAPVPPIVWATLSGFTILAGYLAGQGGTAAPKAHATSAQLQSLFRRQLARQHRLRSFLIWCWLMPLFIGLAEHFLLAPEPSLVRPIIGSMLLLSLAACIQMTNAERGRIVRFKIKELGVDSV